MTVADLIRELQAMPQFARAMVRTEGYYSCGDHEPEFEPLSDEDATEADAVEYLGGGVVIVRGK